MSCRLLLIGHVDDPEFREFIDFVQTIKGIEIQQARDLQGLRSPADAAAPAGSSDVPELIVVLERHPDEYSSADVRTLIETYPLARLLCGYAPWSESAGRTRGTWPLAVWTPLSLLRERLLSELAVLRGERPALPITADRAELFELLTSLEAVPSLEADRATPWRVAVDVVDRDYRELLEQEVLERGGILVAPSESWHVLLFDAHPEPQRQRRLQTCLAERTAPVGLILLLHELPSLEARQNWSQLASLTDYDWRLVSKLAPLNVLFSSWSRSCGNKPHAV